LRLSALAHNRQKHNPDGAKNGGSAQQEFRACLADAALVDFSTAWAAHFHGRESLETFSAVAPLREG
jgi:hypothetical protein